MGIEAEGETRGFVYRIGLRVAAQLGSVREQEYRLALRFLEGCHKILDVGCGTGTLLIKAPERISGIDLNPENVEFCTRQGLEASVGDARQIPFPDGSFDGVHCSHLLQVLMPGDAATVVRELARITKPGGIVVITTLNWFTRFFRHPENARPYPPDAIRRLFAPARDATSPMFPGMPKLIQEAIWFRHPPLMEFTSPASHSLDRLFGVVNRVQYLTYLRKYWTYDAYMIKLRLSGG